MFEIALGRYYSSKSPIHSLDPRVKGVGLVIYILSLFYFSSLAFFAFAFLSITVTALLTRVPLKYILKGLGRTVLLSSFFALLIVLLEDNALRKALINVIRFSLTVTASSLFTLATSPGQISKGMEKMLGKGLLKKPVHILSTIVMIAFSFIPILSQEAERVVEAQKSRGCSFEEKGLIKKAKIVLPILVPLFVSAYKRADELALSMDGRGFNKTSSTSLYPLHYSYKDCIAYLIVISYALLSYFLEVKLWI